MTRSYDSSRRGFLAGGAAAAAAAVLGPSFLVACGTPGTPATSTGALPDDGAPATGTVRISNWPSYMVDGFLASFEKASGLTADYREDFNDNEQWFAKYKEMLARKQDIGADLVVPTEFMAARLKGLGWLNEIREQRVPNLQNLRPDLLDSAIDPGRRYIAPWMSGMVGLGYNRALAGRPITKVEDLWDPAFRGKVSLLSDLQDGVGMIMQSQGASLADPTLESVQSAVEEVARHKDSGQIRRFTGNDYLDDLDSGNLIVAQAYSGDVAQLKAGNPDLDFVVPESGGTWFIDTQVIPYTTANQKGAEAWIDFVYDRANYAKLIAVTKFVPVLSEMTEELAKIDPALAGNPLINPAPETMARMVSWPALTDEQTQAFNTAYAAVTGG